MPLRQELRSLWRQLPSPTVTNVEHLTKETIVLTVIVMALQGNVPFIHLLVGSKACIQWIACTKAFCRDMGDCSTRFTYLCSLLDYAAGFRQIGCIIDHISLKSVGPYEHVLFCVG
jgi:hypothetical protein